MKRYYGIDNKDELLKFIKRNRLVRLDEVDSSKSKSPIRIIMTAQY